MIFMYIFKIDTGDRVLYQNSSAYYFFKKFAALVTLIKKARQMHLQECYFTHTHMHDSSKQKTLHLKINKI